MHSERPAPLAPLLAGVGILALLVLGAWWLDTQNEQLRSGLHAHYRYSVQPATIQDWMTFGYLDSVFSLPPSYLEETLGIEDSRYPDLSLRSYAIRNGLDPALFLARVRAAVASSTGLP